MDGRAANDGNPKLFSDQRRRTSMKYAIVHGQPLLGVGRPILTLPAEIERNSGRIDMQATSNPAGRYNRMSVGHCLCYYLEVYWPMAGPRLIRRCQ
jgi:hypothetical protein